jgi:predicted RNA-binding protein with PIN domain
MRWLIDGYNVIRRDPDLRGHEVQSLEAGRRALVHLVAGLARQSTDEFTIVFDGARRGSAPSPGGRVTVLFSRPPETADDVMMRLAGQWHEAAIVVTSDRAIQHAAARARCAVLGAEEFLFRASPAVPEAAADVDDDEPRSAAKRGNPRRLSKRARAASRALRRLPPR